MSRLFAVLSLLMTMAVSEAVSAQTGPYVFKSSIRITTRKFLRYFATPSSTTPQYNTNCWAPRVELNVQGPLEGGAQLSLHFFKPDP